jgi:hypothetical protein
MQHGGAWERGVRGRRRGKRKWATRWNHRGVGGADGANAAKGLARFARDGLCAHLCARVRAATSTDGPASSEGPNPKRTKKGAALLRNEAGPALGPLIPSEGPLIPSEGPLIPSGVGGFMAACNVGNHGTKGCKPPRPRAAGRAGAQALERPRRAAIGEGQTNARVEPKVPGQTTFGRAGRSGGPQGSDMGVWWVGGGGVTACRGRVQSAPPGPGRPCRGGSQRATNSAPRAHASSLVICGQKAQIKLADASKSFQRPPDACAALRPPSKSEVHLGLNATAATLAPHARALSVPARAQTPPPKPPPGGRAAACGAWRAAGSPRGRGAAALHTPAVQLACDVAPVPAVDVPGGHDVHAAVCAAALPPALQDPLVHAAHGAPP